MKNRFLSLLLTLFLLASCASSTFERRTAQVGTQSTDALSCFNHIATLMCYSPGFNRRATAHVSQVNFKHAATLREIEKAYGGWSFFEMQSQFSPAKIKGHNRRLSKLLEPQTIKEQRDSKYVYRLTSSEAQKFYDDFEVNPVGACSANYEPAGVRVGFCFGRATIAHVEALRMGVHPTSIKKIWVVGDMKEWGHHVATMIKTEDGWMVFDDELGLNSAHRWMQIQRNEKRPGSKPLMFFVSSPERFGPSNNGAYSTADLFGDGVNDYYNGFFRDYFTWVREKGQTPTFREMRRQN